MKIRVPFHELSRLKGIETEDLNSVVIVFKPFHELSRLQGIETCSLTPQATRCRVYWTFHELSGLKGIETSGGTGFTIAVSLIPFP